MPVSIRLGEELEERLTRVSKKLRVAKTEVIKRSLAAFLDQIEPGKGGNRGAYGGDRRRLGGYGDLSVGAGAGNDGAGVEHRLRRE